MLEVVLHHGSGEERGERGGNRVGEGEIKREGETKGERGGKGETKGERGGKRERERGRGEGEIIGV